MHESSLTNEVKAKGLLTIREMRRLIGNEKLGRPTAYAIARRYGVRLGRRLLIPAWVVEALLDGRLEGFRAVDHGGRP